MRWLLFGVVVATVLPIYAQPPDVTHAQREPRVRRRMGFTPELPHARFETQPSYTPSTLKDPKDPFAIATDYMRDVIKPLHPTVSFHIREDSYTDNVTGITHVYVRQSVFATEVANGEIQFAIKDGEVLAVSDTVSLYAMMST